MELKDQFRFKCGAYPIVFTALNIGGGTYEVSWIIGLNNPHSCFYDSKDVQEIIQDGQWTILEDGDQQ